MSCYDNLILEKGVEADSMPIDLEPYQIRWQTKSIESIPSFSKYKISADGRLLREEFTRREMTEDELDQKAKEKGYDSWDKWEKSDEFGPLSSWKFTKDEVRWEDHNMHGEFTFYVSTKALEEFDNYFITYRAVFTKGELDKIELCEFKS